jgi:hypothetical protein
MISLKNIIPEYRNLTKENLERELASKGYNAYDLARYYIKGFKKFNYPIKSDLRDDDYNNSLIARIQNNKLIISDFGYKIGMTIYDYLIEKYSLMGKNSFYQALEMIRHDFNLKELKTLLNPRKLHTNHNIPTKYNKEIKDSSLPVKIEVKRQRKDGDIYWSKEDIEYWNSYGISISKLEEKNIAPLESFWITNYNKDGLRKKFNVSNELCYVYPFYRNKQGFFMYKIYLPSGFMGNKDFKWVSNVNKKVIQNIQHIPTSGELLIIQSSYKDIMLMEELILDVNCIAFNGEGMWCTDKIWYELRKNWKYIVYFADNDSHKKSNSGIKFAKKYAEKYKIPYICTPDNTTSDITDYYKRYGKDKTFKFLKDTMFNIKLLV